SQQAFGSRLPLGFKTQRHRRCVVSAAAEQAPAQATPRIKYTVKSAAELEQRVVLAPPGLTVEFLRREEDGEPPILMSLYGWEYEDASRYELVVSPWLGPDGYV